MSSSVKSTRPRWRWRGCAGRCWWSLPWPRPGSWRSRRRLGGDGARQDRVVLVVVVGAAHVDDARAGLGEELLAFDLGGQGGLRLYKMPDIKLFAGNATPELAKKISERLYISLGDATVGRFSDGEIQVQINENVRGADVFIIHLPVHRQMTT